MKLIIIFGPPAVGKMTVGRELEKITELKLFHNHMTIELVAPFFDFGTKPFNKLVSLFRKRIFEEVAKSNLEGLIFTFVWAMNLPSEKKYIDKIMHIFQKENADIYFVELETTLEERLRRNKSTKRLKEKPTKRDIQKSEKILLEHESQYIFNSTASSALHLKNYVKINNTDLAPDEVARRIKKQFRL